MKGSQKVIELLNRRRHDGWQWWLWRGLRCCRVRNRSVHSRATQALAQCASEVKQEALAGEHSDT